MNEKLTLENLHSKLQECCYLAQDDKPIISQGSIKIIRDLIKQIRDEIIEKRLKSQSYYTSKAMQDINEVFDKYINEL